MNHWTVRSPNNEVDGGVVAVAVEFSTGCISVMTTRIGVNV